jgi:Leucine-rich repeat (LRR) protein
VYRYLDFNPIKRLTAGQLPASLQELIFEKSNLESLAGFVFPNSIKKLSLKGNVQLQSLYGLVLPTGVTTVYVPANWTQEWLKRCLIASYLYAPHQQRL